MGSQLKLNTYFKSIQICMFYIAVFASSLPAYTEVTSDGSNSTNQTTAEWIFWGSGSPARVEYEVILAELALEQSKAKYGPYKLSLDVSSYSALRGNQEIRKNTYHFTASGDYINRDIQNKDYIRVPIQLWEGLQGFRQLMIHADDWDKFDKIKSPQALKTLKPGQGENWTEVLIYQDNGIEVITASDLTTLFRMLSHKRFDYLPLGINEMGISVQMAKRQFKELVVHPGVLIHYPLNVYFQVNRNYPELAERLEYGLKRAIANGEFERTVAPYLNPIRAIRDRENTTIVKIKNDRTQ